MPLRLLKIENLRNIRAAELEFGAGINVVWGKNGAGKTTILEALYVLARGRSFRGSRAGPLIGVGAEHFSVFGRMELATGAATTIGVEKGKSRIRVRVNNSDLVRLSELARLLPLNLITPNIHQVLEQGPGLRRRFLDWGVFHVEQTFFSAYTRFNRALKQRNAALKTMSSTAYAWDREIACYGERLNDIRVDYIAALAPVFDKVAAELGVSGQVRLYYQKGWSGDGGLLGRLESSRQEDKKRGYTSAGPHRADLVVEFKGEAAEKKASRGEQKLIMAALTIAQNRLLVTKTDQEPVFLVDDLAAELDRENRTFFLRTLSGLGCQVIITGTDASVFDDVPQARMFHVKQGVVG